MDKQHPTPDVTVRLDDRIRLISAVLAATDWPDKAYERRPHLAHAHARATRKFLAEHQSHDAVRTMQNLLDQGAPLEALYTFVMVLSWPSLETKALPRWVPPRWHQQLRDFYDKTGLEQWWKEEADEWNKSLSESRKMFEKVSFKPFLQPFLGEIPEDLIFVPNISYPAEQEVGIRLGKELIAIAPPRLAWGESAPWPFDEDPGHVYRAAISQFGRILLLTQLRANGERVAEASKTALPISEQLAALHPSWEDQFITLFIAGAVAIYLEDHISKAEAQAYVLMERKTRGMTVLAGTVSVLRRYLSEQQNGRYNGLLDFLPLFPKQLRVAKRIVSI